MKNILLRKDSPFSVSGGVLTAGDVNAYRVIIDMGTDVSAMTAMAVCQENGEFSADFDCSGTQIGVMLVNSMYSSPGFITVRLAVSDGDSVLTAKEVVFRVVEANNDSTLAETQSGTISNILTSVQGCEQVSQNALIVANQALALTTKKADADDVYSREEINGKLSAVYSYKGSVQNVDGLPLSPEAGDVYNILQGGVLSVVSRMAESFTKDEIYSWVCDINNFQTVVPSSSLGLQKGDIFKIELADGTLISDNAVVGEISTDGSTYYQIICSAGDFVDVPSTPDGIMISRCIDEYVQVSDGTNAAWTGESWDVLGGTVDLSGYSTTAEMQKYVDSAVGLALEGEY